MKYEKQQRQKDVVINKLKDEIEASEHKMVQFNIFVFFVSCFIDCYDVYLERNGGS